jgi:hypothetical protein
MRETADVHGLFRVLVSRGAYQKKIGAGEAVPIDVREPPEPASVAAKIGDRPVSTGLFAKSLSRGAYQKKERGEAR